MMYSFVLSKKPLLVIISLISGVFYLMALLVTSIIMSPIPFNTQPAYLYPLAAIIISVIAQESCRFSFIHVYRRVEVGLRPLTTIVDVPALISLEDSAVCLASGIGYATVHSVMNSGYVFASTIPRRGDYFTEICGEVRDY